jgi:hypothetical protein
MIDGSPNANLSLFLRDHPSDRAPASNASWPSYYMRREVELKFDRCAYRPRCRRQEEETAPAHILSFGL